MVLLRPSMDIVKKEKVRRPLRVTDRLRCMHTCVCVCGWNNDSSNTTLESGQLTTRGTGGGCRLTCESKSHRRHPGNQRTTFPFKQCSFTALYSATRLWKISCESTHTHTTKKTAHSRIYSLCVPCSGACKQVSERLFFIFPLYGLFFLIPQQSCRLLLTMWRRRRQTARPPAARWRCSSNG